MQVEKKKNRFASLARHHFLVPRFFVRFVLSILPIICDVTYEENKARPAQTRADSWREIERKEVIRDAQEIFSASEAFLSDKFMLQPIGQPQEDKTAVMVVCNRRYLDFADIVWATNFPLQFHLSGHAYVEDYCECAPCETNPGKGEKYLSGDGGESQCLCPASLCDCLDMPDAVKKGLKKKKKYVNVLLST